MRDMVACFSEHAVRVSETTCSSYANANANQLHHHLPTQPPCIISQNTTPAFQTAVTCLYKITLSTNKQLLVTVTWSSTQMGHQGLTISFGDDPSSSSVTTFKLSTSSRLFRKKKGARSIDLDDDSKIDLLWDLSEVNYESGVEPIDGYYIVIMVDSELGLMLGDLCREVASKKIKNGASTAKSSLVSRREHYGGTALYSTKAQFSERGAIHDISIRCSGENGTLKQPVLSVSMDKRTVMRVKRLQWNFRGNQTIFIDGLLIDLFWDVHDWFFSPGNGLAVFMFRRRSGDESRLWLEEKLAADKKQDQDKPEFSLLIYASKSP